jgi:hypothetical protein
MGGRRCDAASAHRRRYFGRPALLLWASSAATTGDWCCCHERPTLLPCVVGAVMLRAHSRAATLGLRHCYHGRPPLLSLLVGVVMLQVHTAAATLGVPLCYFGPPVLLPWPGGDAAQLLPQDSWTDGIASGDGHIFYKPSAMAAPLLQVVGRLLPAVPGVASFAAAGDRRFYHGLVDGGAAGGCRVDRRWSTMPYSPAAEIPRRDSSPAAILARRSYEGHGGPVCEQRSSTAETEPEKIFAVDASGMRD